jgi:UDP-N-acetylglucosamine acyltransferase
MTSLIHPTAIIEPGAELDTDVTVGPYAIIGANVKIGAGTTIGAHSEIKGHTTIGRDNSIASFAALGGPPQDMKYQDEPTRLEIGERNTIREFTTIHTGTIQDQGVTRIGNDNWIMAYVHIAHDCQIGNHTIFASNAQVAGHVQVGDWAILGGMSGVHQFVRIGAHAMLGGASALVQDIPPFVIAAGNKAVPYGVNAEGLKRRGFEPATMQALKKAYRLLYKSGFALEQAKQALQDLLSEQPAQAHTQLKILIDFVSSSERGVIR